jgi:DNA (cytosine-5)-methyltransferase 1
VATARNACASPNGRLDFDSETFLVAPVAKTLTRGAESAGKGGYAGRRQEDDDNLVGYNITPSNSNKDYNAREAEYAQAVTTQSGSAPSARGGDVITKGWAVRRLTPTECERLQGFPDGYTAVTYRKKPAADGPRYKGLGNSIAVNVLRWIGRRIDIVETLVRGVAA